MIRRSIFRSSNTIRQSILRPISQTHDLREYSNETNTFSQFTADTYRYTGQVEAVIFDWSGTLCDPGVLAPAVVFVEVFKQHGIDISMNEARGPMGLRKDLHIGALLKTKNVMEQWIKVYGRVPDDKDCDEMFKKFVPLQLECLPKYGTIIRGADHVTDMLRTKHGIRLGLTTGFTKTMSDVLRVEAERQGVVLDTTVAGDEVKNGARPSPAMLYKNLDHLGIHRIQSVVKVDDTVSGIGEAVNAGCWSVGVCRWSNYTNYESLEQLKSMPYRSMLLRSAFARAKLIDSGAHYVAETINELPMIIRDINRMMSQGIQPMTICNHNYKN